MNGGQTYTGREGDGLGEAATEAVPQALPTPSGNTAVGHRRRRRRHSSLSSKLRRNHKVARLRRIATWVFLGLGVVATSIYLARSSTAYEPVPTAPGG
jgi:hypothetical protein